jgi:hypothetical protein
VAKRGKGATKKIVWPIVVTPFLLIGPSWAQTDKDILEAMGEVAGELQNVLGL